MLGIMERETSTSAQRIGDAAERHVAQRLEGAGWEILARNLRVGRDELDLVAIDPGPPRTLVLVEVRQRSGRDFGLAEETLDWRKRAALRRAMSGLLDGRVLPDGRPLPVLPVRIDLVAMDRDHEGSPSLRHHRGLAP